MNDNPVSITAALSDAWERMRVILFRPFDIGKWFALGFTAWLAGLAGGSGGGGSSFSTGSGSGDSDHLDWSSSGMENVRSGFERLLDHPLWLAAGLFGCVFLIVLALAVLWVSSRGKFMFLDNVVHNRAEVVRPWKRYRRVANSHFGFQLAFIAVIMILVVGLALFVFATISAGVDLAFDIPGFLAAATLVSGLLTVVLSVAFVQYFLDGFVVPLMYRYDLTVIPAWSRFGALFRRHPWTFLLSGPFLVILGLAVVLLVIAAGLITCCVGFLLIAIPYIGTVVLLPVPVTYRGFTVALLDQIDPGFFPGEKTEADTEPRPVDAPAST